MSDPSGLSQPGVKSVQVLTNRGREKPAFASLLERLGEDVSFIQVEHPAGGTLTLGLKSPRGRESAQRFHFRKADGGELCTNRIINTDKILSTLERFYAQGVAKTCFVWKPVSNFRFDHELPRAGGQNEAPASIPEPTQRNQPIVRQRYIPGLNHEARFALKCLLVLLIVTGTLWALLRLGKFELDGTKESAEKTRVEAMQSSYELRQLSPSPQPAPAQPVGNPAVSLPAAQTQPVSQIARAPSYTASRPPEYTSVLGNLWIGTILYDKETKMPFGLVIGINENKIEVADKISVGSVNTRVQTHLYDRS